MLKEKDFEVFMLGEPDISSSKAVKSRMSKARKAEKLLGKTLDEIVSDDDRMFESLECLHKFENPEHTPLQNAVRKYYKFVNGKEFPRKRNYHSAKHP